MRTVKVKFVDFDEGYNPDESMIMKILTKKYNVEYSETPDYLIYSVFGDDNIKYGDCIKIFCTAENLCPDFNLCDYAIGFEWLDYGDRYLRFPFEYSTKYQNEFERIESEEKPITEKLTQRKFCNFVYSNGNANPIREKFFNYLSDNYKKVDSGGKYKNNIDGVCENKLEFQQNYKFSIAFENTAHPGYTTEKLIDALAAYTVPIYWGDPEIGKVFNTDAFLVIHGEEDFEYITHRIQELDENPVLYMNMLRMNALKDELYTYNVMQDKLEKFILNIMEQPKEKAYRRNRLYWGKMYQQKQEAYVKALGFKKKYINPIKGIFS